MTTYRQTGLGSKLRYLRRRSGLTQEQLGEKAELHYSYIGQLERGDKAPSLKTLQKLAEALNTRLEFFLETTGEQPSSRSERLKWELKTLLHGRKEEELELALEVMKTLFAYLEKKYS